MVEFQNLPKLLKCLWQNTTTNLFLLKRKKVAYNIDQWIDIMVMEDHDFVSKSSPITHSKLVVKHFICLFMIFPLSIKLSYEGINQQIVRKGWWGLSNATPFKHRNIIVLTYYYHLTHDVCEPTFMSSH
jgi:hypothetical protein